MVTYDDNFDDRTLWSFVTGSNGQIQEKGPKKHLFKV